MIYQPAPPGVWRSSPARRLLWAVEGVLHKLTREIPESGRVADWKDKLDAALADPVTAFGWEGWYVQHAVTKDEDGPDVPADVTAAWESIPGLVDELWRDAGQTRTATEGLPFDPADLETALQSTMQLIRDAGPARQDALRSIMRRAMEEHQGQFGFARQVKAEWAEYAGARARMIAVTEWNRAASAATYEGYRKTGVETKRWFTVGDDRVCPVCEQNSVDGELGIDEEFSSGDLYPPAHPGCRCNISSA